MDIQKQDNLYVRMNMGKPDFKPGGRSNARLFSDDFLRDIINHLIRNQLNF